MKKLLFGQKNLPLPEALLDKVGEEFFKEMCKKASMMTSETRLWFLAAAWARIAVGLQPRIGNDSIEYYKATVLDPVNCPGYSRWLREKYAHA